MALVLISITLPGRFNTHIIQRCIGTFNIRVLPLMHEPGRDRRMPPPMKIAASELV